MQRVLAYGQCSLYWHMDSAACTGIWTLQRVLAYGHCSVYWHMDIAACTGIWTVQRVLAYGQFLPLERSGDESRTQKRNARYFIHFRRTRASFCITICDSTEMWHVLFTYLNVNPIGCNRKHGNVCFSLLNF